MKLTQSSTRTAALLAALSLLPTLAHAHPGHPGHDGLGFAAGVAHPLTGFDHILAMLAVGLWAAQLGGRAFWVVPATFVSVMTAGSFLGMAHIGLPFVEQGILASVLILGVLIAASVRLPVAVSAAIVGVFAVMHGYAHGAEMPGSASSFAYIGGFAAATALLHACGMFAGRITRQAAATQWTRFAGVAIVAGGVLLALN